MLEEKMLDSLTEIIELLELDIKLEQEMLNKLTEKIKEMFPFQYWKMSIHDFLDYKERIKNNNNTWYNDAYFLGVDNKIINLSSYQYLDECQSEIFHNIYNMDGIDNVYIYKTEFFGEEDGCRDSKIKKIDKLPKDIHFSTYSDWGKITLKVIVNGVSYSVEKRLLFTSDNEWYSNIIKDKSNYSSFASFWKVDGHIIRCSPFEMANKEVIKSMYDIILNGYKKMYDYSVLAIRNQMIVATKKSPSELLDIIETLDKLVNIESNPNSQILRYLAINMRNNPTMSGDEIEKLFYDLKSVNKFIKYFPSNE